MTLSLLLYVFSIILFQYRDRKSKKKTFFVLSSFFGILTVIFFAADYLGGNGIDNSVLYHVQYGFDGAGFGDLSRVIVSSVLAILMTSAISFVASFKKLQAKVVAQASLFALILLIIAILFNPTFLALLKISGFDLLEPDNEELREEFYSYYREPMIEPSGAQKNLVYIYLEGVEQTHFDEELFPELTPNLKSLQEKSVYFSNIKNTVGTKFTIGGMVASQCGVPLLASSHLNSLGGSDVFLPKISCVGELLSEQGYRMSYFGGADLDFAGKGKFLRGHGFDDVSGLHELQQRMKNPEYKSWWGLYDDTTFEFAFDHFNTLSVQDERFALFTLTLDAHHPWGNPSASCDGLQCGDGQSEILNAVHCSDKLVSELVETILESPFSRDTIVVVASDHLALQNSATETLEKSQSGRNNLFMILNSGHVSQEIERLGSTLDIGTTLLPLLGFEGGIGLGRDLLDKNYSEADAQYIHQNVERWKPVYDDFWDFPKLQTHIEIIPGTSEEENDISVRFDSREFGGLMMIELDQDFQSNIVFKHMQSDMINIDEEYEVFKNRIGGREMGEKIYIIVDACTNLKNIEKSLPEGGSCYLLGQKKDFIEFGHIEEKIMFTKDSLEQYFN